MRQLDNIVWSMKSQIMMTEKRLSRMIAALSIVESMCDCGKCEKCERCVVKKDEPLAPLTRSQSLLLRLGFARFRWFRRRVGGRWCYRRCWINDYPHSSSTVCVHRWERHPTATMGEDILEVEQYEMMKLPEARLVDRS